MKINAKWLRYFDGHKDIGYERPCCPICSEVYGPTPIVYKESKYICINCQKEAELDRKQRKWIDDMRKTKTTIEKCFVCGAYKFVTKKRRNPITKKWETCSGKCENCGCKMIV